MTKGINDTRGSDSKELDRVLSELNVTEEAAEFRKQLKRLELETREGEKLSARERKQKSNCLRKASRPPSSSAKNVILEFNVIDAKGYECMYRATSIRDLRVQLADKDDVFFPCIELFVVHEREIRIEDSDDIGKLSGGGGDGKGHNSNTNGEKMRRDGKVAAPQRPYNVKYINNFGRHKKKNAPAQWGPELWFDVIKSHSLNSHYHNSLYNNHTNSDNALPQDNMCCTKDVIERVKKWDKNKNADFEQTMLKHVMVHLDSLDELTPHEHEYSAHIRILHELGANLDARVEIEHDGFVHNLALIHLAAGKGLLHLVDTLTSWPLLVEVHTRSDHGNSALHFAAGGGHAQVFSLLLDKRADPMAENEEGYTPLHSAVYHHHTSTTEFLLRKDNEYEMNVNVDARDRFGSTPLHVAAEQGHVETLLILIQAGANTLMVNEDGESPFDLAWNEECRGVLASA